MLLSCRPAGFKRRRVSSGQGLARPLSPFKTSNSLQLAAQLEIDHYAFLQPRVQVEFAPLILKAMQERLEDESLSN